MMSIKRWTFLLSATLVLSTFLNSCSYPKVPNEEDMAAYLMVYFKDETHSLHMALSEDGYTFTAINDGRAVISGDTIAGQRGIRDPHIMRGNDGWFYMAMTDLHIFAQQAGYRSTEWERDGHEYGWGNNKNIVLMKSKDLINWTHSVLHVDKAFPGWENIGCAWAPELIWDDQMDRIMIYFSLRFGNEISRIYYAYINNDFSALETEPRLLFEYPVKNKAYIDGDITKVGSKYHLFYVSHDGVPGIKQAISDSINSGYVYDPGWYDPEPRACEAPNVWKRIGEEKWVLMYDCYGVRPHNFGFSETSDFKTFTHLGRFNEGVMKTTNFSSPKHGAIIHLTKNEATRLEQHWNSVREKNIVEKDFDALTLPTGYTDNIKWNLPLDTLGEFGAVISWKSNNPDYLSDKGKLLKYSPKNQEKIKVSLTATIKSGDTKRNKHFEVSIACEEPDYDAYLFAYFEGNAQNRKNEEQLRFAYSSDAVNWFALNNNEPIIDSDTISQSGGIRDPHILRGEDDESFYIVATDMSTASNGWRANPGIVMLKSDNLLDWQHHTVNLANDYPEKFADAYWVWAPQTIYDPAAGKYMVYFTVRFKDDDKLDFYSAYAKPDFSGFENEPTFMFRAKYGAIDGDIIYKDGIWHLFFKGNTKNEKGEEFENGIKQATASSLQGPWKEHFEYLDAYHTKRTNVEGSSVFKLNNSDSYVLMYDLYSSGRYEFQRSTDLYEFTSVPESFTKNFHPRHGSVISITKEETMRLEKKWSGIPNRLFTESESKRNK